MKENLIFSTLFLLQFTTLAQLFPVNVYSVTTAQ
jgi:hypothetical protein